MAIYHVAYSGRAGINTANSPIVNLLATTRKLRVLEVGIFIQVAMTTAPVVAMQRSTARGTQTATLAPIKKDSGDAAATATLDTTWSANPTFSTATPHIRAAGIPLAIGNGMVFDLEELELVTGSTEGLVIFNINASGATLGSFAGYFMFEE